MKCLVAAELQTFLKALASETRQRLLMLFIDGKERTVNEVAAEAGLSQAATSEHLSVMRQAGLLQCERRGKEVIYRPDRQRILLRLTELQGLLVRCC
ncbi:MAG: winged helix-turn-helix transcriptional regulator [Gammaproteobacteria bacterium]|nr:winged helix-turn-helix transcriptional regulator [Gammaproteobacteria bacterium]